MSPKFKVHPKIPSNFPKIQFEKSKFYERQKKYNKNLYLNFFYQNFSNQINDIAQNLNNINIKHVKIITPGIPRISRAKITFI